MTDLALSAVNLQEKLTQYGSQTTRTVSLGQQQTPIYHTQFAVYPVSVSELATAVYDTLTIQPGHYDTYDEFSDEFLSSTFDEVRGVQNSLNLDSDVSTDTPPVHLDDAVLSLDSLYNGFHVSEDGVPPYERYGQQRRQPQSQAALAADILTVAHTSMAEYGVDTLWTSLPESSPRRDCIRRQLYTFRDCIEKSHGWSVFAPASPSPELAAELVTMLRETELDVTLKQLYTLFILPSGARKFEPHGHAYKSAMKTASNEIAKDLGLPGDEFRYACAGTTVEDLEQLNL